MRFDSSGWSARTIWYTASLIGRLRRFRPFCVAVVVRRSVMVAVERLIRPQSSPRISPCRIPALRASGHHMPEVGIARAPTGVEQARDFLRFQMPPRLLRGGRKLDRRDHVEIPNLLGAPEEVGGS